MSMCLFKIPSFVLFIIFVVDLLLDQVRMGDKFCFINEYSNFWARN